MRTPAVPRFDDAAIEAEANLKWRGNREKVATTPTAHLAIDGVEISSRYNKAHEFDSMAGMVKGVDEQHRSLFENIWCDSQENACYSVKLKPCTKRQARAIADQLEQDCCEHDGGHNGIWIDGTNGAQLVVDPHWVENCD